MLLRVVSEGQRWSGPRKHAVSRARCRRRWSRIDGVIWHGSAPNPAARVKSAAAWMATARAGKLPPLFGETGTSG